MNHSDATPCRAIPVWNALSGAFENKRFPQMLLLDGEAGVGKKKLAIELAKMLCENSSEPIIWLTPIDDASNRDAPAKIEAGVAELSQKFTQNPYHTGYITDSALISVDMVKLLLKNFELKADGNRVVIITNANLMNGQAANKLLKTFEEVPPNTYFILTAVSRHSLLPTVRSRAACFSVPLLKNEDISEILKDYGYADASEDILEFAAGSAGKAMAALDSNYLQIKGKIADYACHALKGDASEAIFCAAGMEKSINSAALFLEGLALYLLKRQESLSNIHSINFLLRAMLAKKFTAEHAIQNMALRLAQKAI